MDNVFFELDADGSEGLNREELALLLRMENTMCKIEDCIGCMEDNKIDRCEFRIMCGLKDEDHDGHFNVTGPRLTTLLQGCEIMLRKAKAFNTAKEAANKSTAEAFVMSQNNDEGD